jgi:hypothetical protein
MNFSSQKKLFLIDAIGALVSIFFLGFVLVYLEDKIGMPRNVLYILASIPFFFAIYSFSCYFFIQNNWSPFLKGIALMNLLYCFLTIGLLFFYDHNLTLLGWTYFIVELIILFVLIKIEFKASRKNSLN